MTTQPKPTGEWTARKAATGYIAALYCGNTEIYRQSLGALEDLERIADAHNAALDEAVDAADQEILLLRQQLAAERASGLKKLFSEMELNKQLRDQLAAEREELKRVKEFWHGQRKYRDEAEQLTAERDKANVRETELICERDYFKKELDAERDNRKSIESINKSLARAVVRLRQR